MWLALVARAPRGGGQLFPPLTGRVVDQAHLLTPTQVADLTNKSEALEKGSGRQFVVATVSSLEGHQIEDYAYRLRRLWTIGSRKTHDGLLLRAPPTEPQV